MRLLLLTTVAAASIAACGQKAATAPAEVAGAALAPDAVAVTASDIEAPAEPAGNARVFVDAEGVAINGYDPVSYFNAAPSAGDPAYVSEYNGATYRFASADNKAAFDADPAAYEPQYGGYCAYGAAKGVKFKTAPETGTVVGGKLFFNKDRNVQELWNKDQPGFIAEADGQWPAILDNDIAG